MMHIQQQQRRRAFSIWLRTGRLPSIPNADGIELKFNPWHDPENGRFTFAGTGNYYGRGGSAESRGQGSSKVEYISDPARPSINSIEEADAWRVEELAKHSHKPDYRKAIEARYQFYKRQFEGPQRQDANQGSSAPKTDTQASTPSASTLPNGSSASSGAPASSVPRSPKPAATRSAPTRQNTRPTVSGDREASGDFVGGGGDFHGGGASGSWEVSPAASAQRTIDVDPLPKPDSGSKQPQRQGSPQSDSARWRKVERNGYLYEIDEQDRTRRVSGQITLNADQGRSQSVQRAAGGSDRRATDHGGHYIARRFNGPTEAFNHFAQDANFNRSGYRRLEEEWAREKRVGKTVRVKIVPVYGGASQRPSRLNVWFEVDGKLKSRNFPNESQGAKNAE